MKGTYALGCLDRVVTAVFTVAGVCFALMGAWNQAAAMAVLLLGGIAQDVSRAEWARLRREGGEK